MDKLIYPAIFHPEADGGYSVSFPDLLGCVTEGDTLDEAVSMAKDALGIYLYTLKEDDEKIPVPSAPSTLNIADNEFTSLIEWDEQEYLERTDSKAVKKTVTIPSWLNKRAEKCNINFSQALQQAIKHQLNLA